MSVSIHVVRTFTEIEVLLFYSLIFSANLISQLGSFRFSLTSSYLVSFCDANLAQYFLKFGA